MQARTPKARTGEGVSAKARSAKADVQVSPHMKTDLVDVNETRKNVRVEIPSDVVDAEIDRIARDYSRKAQIPGFRPGKAPARVIKQRFKDQILHDVAHGLIPRAVDDALRERGVEAVDTPDIRDVTVEEGQALTFTASFDTVPSFEPGDYATVSLRRPSSHVEEAAVEQALQRLRERAARFEPVEDRRRRRRRHRDARHRPFERDRHAGRRAGERREERPAHRRGGRARRKSQSAGVRSGTARPRGGRDEELHHALPGRLPDWGVGEYRRLVYRDGEGHQAAGPPRSGRRVRQGSRRLRGPRCAEGSGSRRPRARGAARRRARHAHRR